MDAQNEDEDFIEIDDQPVYGFYVFEEDHGFFVEGYANGVLILTAEGPSLITAMLEFMRIISYRLGRDPLSLVGLPSNDIDMVTSLPR